MYPVGALNPQPANNAREQLLQHLVQQLQQRHGQQQQDVGTPAASLFDFMRKRQQQMQAMGGLARPEGAGNQTALTALTNANGIMPSMMRSALGAAAPRFDAGYSSAVPGAAVPHSPGGGVIMPPITSPGGMTSPVPATIPSASGSAGGGVIPPGVGIGGQAGMSHAGIGAPPSINQINGGAFTTPGGLVPIQPGVYINPQTGAVYGGRLVPQ